MGQKSVLVLVAQGTEELEAVTIIDLLRRAEVEVVVAGLNSNPITASRGVKLIPDVALEAVLQRSFDMIVLPGGGPGAKNFAQDVRVIELLRRMAKEGKFVCAICAAPTVLAKAGVLAGKRATGYPGMLEEMNLSDVVCTESAVETDGQVITSRGPGTALDFALTLIEALVGTEIRRKVEKGLAR